jgi:curved DNA-binding protein CbpA
VKNYYSILGVREEATPSEIKLAYRNLMKKWHPDVCQHVDARRRTEEVSFAYSVLSCPESRLTHDYELREAGLSSKPLYFKTRTPCLLCNCKGMIKVYEKDSLWWKFLSLFGIERPYNKTTCYDCCGTGWAHRIEEY